ncbi:tRNA (adenosine(37)-N6)-threonylcarbamoyltransferase complex ATPase subunit type 1 TsaE [Ruegeria sp. HKCCD8929]|uniref:tRNA (adenosine(37)-N6)-threonylcarbamoyltransferase complex ATPase subunit type 1 TsaE n=1 Tax=Ruegeria sp. HKCCD8929 TaxID=2683006 RepID=UPI0014885D25|nr:tRNA (adenosine(37)-N6)-threonylcarbamoyltransferase complex ATPase subunit type 1 TsaE [Ruegeria sp. HKCCD8929]
MTATALKLTLNSPQATAHFASSLGAVLSPGDCVLLGGAIGSGKTHFARHLIQSLMAIPEDVPSPTFTLVQVYDTEKGEVWHSDLYRLTALDEIEELGLTEAFETAICLVEWPDRLGPLAPENALMLDFATDPDQEETRHLTATWTDPKWSKSLETLA